MKKPSLVILAAGMGSRYGGLKQIDGVGPNEEGIIEYSIYDAIRAGFGKVVFVIRHDIEAPFREKFEGLFSDKIDVRYAFQEMDTEVPAGIDHTRREKPWGTAHAMLAAAPEVDEPFAVINADDYYGVEAFHAMADFLMNDCRPDLYAMVGYRLSNTLSPHGHVNRGIATMDSDMYLTSVVERLKIETIGETVTYLHADNQRYALQFDELVSMNFWGFHPSVFEYTREMFHDFAHTNREAPKAEFLIPEVVDTLINNGRARVRVLRSEDKWYGVTYREDKEAVEAAFEGLIGKEVYPSPLWR